MERRKTIRLEGVDYSLNGVYFVTICVKDRTPILSKIVNTSFGSNDDAVGASSARPQTDSVPKIELTGIGTIVDNAITLIPSHYQGVLIDKYVIMPNHIHMLIRLSGDNGQQLPTGQSVPASVSISRMIQQMKGYVTKQCGQAFWQKSFYDHIVRTDKDYIEIWKYIEENPFRWDEDDLFVFGS